MKIHNHANKGLKKTDFCYYTLVESVSWSLEKCVCSKFMPFTAHKGVNMPTYGLKSIWRSLYFCV